MKLYVAAALTIAMATLGCRPSPVQRPPAATVKIPDVPKISDDRPIEGMSTADLITNLGNETQQKQRDAEVALLDQGAAVVPQLITALDEENWHVRAGVIRVLGMFGGEASAAIPRLTEIAESDVHDAVRDAVKFNLPLIEGEESP